MAVITLGGLDSGDFDLSKVSDRNILALLWLFRWAPATDPKEPATTISYSFASTPDVFSPPPPDGHALTGFAVTTPGQQEAVRTTLALVASSTALTFTELPTELAANATLRFAQGDPPSRMGIPGGHGPGEGIFASNATIPPSVGGAP